MDTNMKTAQKTDMCNQESCCWLFSNPTGVMQNLDKRRRQKPQNETKWYLGQLHFQLVRLISEAVSLAAHRPHHGTATGPLLAALVLTP